MPLTLDHCTPSALADLVRRNAMRVTPSGAFCLSVLKQTSRGLRGLLHSDCRCFFVFCSLCNLPWHPGSQCMSPETQLELLRQRMAGKKDGAEEFRRKVRAPYKP